MTLFGQQHIDEYRATDGEVGYEWQGTTILLLTTTGRKSGQPRTNALIYRDWGTDNSTYLVVASKGGADAHPDWFLNLSTNPDVQVQIKGDTFAARARVATPEERPAMWKHMAAVWPAYDEYQTKTAREIPVVVLERA